jgi:hypothetical protein
MSRLDREAILASVAAKLTATPDPDGVVDLVASQGRIAVVAEPRELKAAIDRLRPLDGYRWVAINAGDLFAVSPMTIGTKIGILDPSGRVLKAADLPRQR